MGVLPDPGQRRAPAFGAGKAATASRVLAGRRSLAKDQLTNDDRHVHKVRVAPAAQPATAGAAQSAPPPPAKG